jgi:hypothetical protein
MHYLEIPAEVLGRTDARELVRFWVCDGEDFVALNSNLFEDKEAEVWGSVAADLIKHAIIAMTLNNPDHDPKKLRGRMVGAFKRRLAERGDHSGHLGQ